MKRAIMLIDDDSDNTQAVELMRKALAYEINKCGWEERLDVYGRQISHADELEEGEINDLIDEIRGYVAKYERVLLAIDLVLMSDDYYCLEQLKHYLMTGILLKRFIFKYLTNEEKSKVNCVFVSSYLDKHSDLRREIDFIIEQEGAIGVSKPKTNWVGAVKEYERKAKKQGEGRKCCSKENKFSERIQQYYDENTLYGDFIGTIFESALK